MCLSVGSNSWLGSNLSLGFADELNLGYLSGGPLWCVSVLHRVFLNTKLPEYVSPPNEALLLSVRSIFCGAYLLHRVFLNAKLPESVSPPNEALLLSVRSIFCGAYLLHRVFLNA